MTIPFSKLKSAWMKDPTFRAEYERLNPEYALAWDSTPAVDTPIHENENVDDLPAA